MPDKKTPFFKKILFVISGLSCLVLLIEVALQIGVHTKFIPFYAPLEKSYYSYNVVPYFSKPCCIKDSISGFRWLGNEAIAYKICRGRIVFYQMIKPNNAGFNSPGDFEPHKKDATVFRWLVFGDSFTDGYFLQQNWPARLYSILKAQHTHIEVHSFALNGSGIKTWAGILNWLNEMNYEYDGVICACFGNDLSRDDFVMDHVVQDCYYGWVDLSQKGDSVKLKKERVIYDPESRENLDAILAGKNAGSDFRLLLPYYIHILYMEMKQGLLIRSQSKEMYDKYIFTKRGEQPVDSLSMDSKYGPKRMLIIRDMMAYCSKANKKVVLASIPDLAGSGIYTDISDIRLNMELQWLASRYDGATFFDGYAAIKGNNPGQLFLKYDGHWNQKGSDLFAERISGLISGESIKSKK